MQTLITTLIVLMAVGYLVRQWWPRRAPAPAADHPASAGCSSCYTCGSCES